VSLKPLQRGTLFGVIRRRLVVPTDLSRDGEFFKTRRDYANGHRVHSGENG
jgi:hypothetical protein